MANWEVKKDNFGWVQLFTVYNADGTLKNLTGYTVTLKVWSESTLKFSTGCILDVNPLTGKCTHTVAASNFDTVGPYFGELELTKPGEKLDVKTFTILVKETAPN